MHPFSTVRCPADVSIYRRRTATVRYVTTQEINVEKRPMPYRFVKSPVIYKSLKWYYSSCICEHSFTCVLPGRHLCALSSKSCSRLRNTLRIVLRLYRIRICADNVVFFYCLNNSIVYYVSFITSLLFVD